MASYTSIFLPLFAVLLAVSANASTFSCGDSDPAACRTKFTTKLLEDFKPLHMNSLRKFITTYLDIGKVVAGELPQNDPLKSELNEALTKVTKDLENFDASRDNIKKIAEIVTKTINDMGINAMKSEKRSEEFLASSEKHHFKESLLGVLRQMHKDFAKLWIEMYAGLRPKDIKAYPAYELVNEAMENIIAKDGVESTMPYYAAATEILGHEFNMEYFQIVGDLI